MDPWNEDLRRTVDLNYQPMTMLKLHEILMLLLGGCAVILKNVNHSDSETSVMSEVYKVNVAEHERRVRQIAR